MLGKVIPWLLKLSYWLLKLFFFLTAHALLMTDCSGSPTDWLLTPFYSFSFSSAYWLLIVFYWLTALSYLLTARARRLSECSRSSAESLWMTRFTASGGQEQPVFHREVQTCGCARRPRVHCLVRDPEVSAVPPLFIFFFLFNKQWTVQTAGIWTWKKILKRRIHHNLSRRLTTCCQVLGHTTCRNKDKACIYMDALLFGC